VLSARGGLAAGGALMTLMGSAFPAAADVGPITISPDGAGWIDTRVVDRGTPVRAKATTKPARTCSQTPSVFGDYATEEQLTSGMPATGPGGWAYRRCSDGSVETAWVPLRPVVPVAEAVERLAREATNRLPLPLPEPGFEPRWTSRAGPTTLVAIPTWFFLEGWKPVTQRTSAGGVWAEVTAAPVSATWWPGDGSPAVRCSGPGRAWSDAAGPGPCRYTYRRSSAAERDNAYEARVSVRWRVSWRGSGGRSGSLPLMERQSTFPVAVAERQTVVTMGGGA
jgi:hypothetical protein